MRFIDTKRFSPVIYGGDVPHERDLYHQPWEQVPIKKKQFTEFIKDVGIIRDRAWWNRQRKRCVEGFTVKNSIMPGGEIFVEGFNTTLLDNGDRYIPTLDLTIHGNDAHITGRHYFYLNFWDIMRLDMDLGVKNVGNPYFTDLSWENWWTRDLQWRVKKDNLWGKRRQGGFSEEEAADTAYNMIFFDDIIQAIVAGEGKYADNLFEFVKRGYNRLARTEFYREIKENNEEEFFTKNTGGHLHCYTAKNNAQVLNRLTCRKVVFEEIGCWQRGMVLKTRAQVVPSQEAMGVRTGLNTFIGTAGEDMIDTEDMEKMMFNPDKFNLLSQPNIYDENASQNRIASFVPAWKFELIDEFGNSLKGSAIEKLNVERENMDAEQRFYSQTSKPFKPTDMFNNPTGGYFGPVIVQYCNETRAYIHTHPSAFQLERGHLALNEKRNWLKGVHFIPDPDNGPFVIREHPDINQRTGMAFENVNNAATDSYDQDESFTSNSKGATTIFKGFNQFIPYDYTRIMNNWVAMLLQRPDTKQGGRNIFYENSALLCLYYMAPNMVEWSKLLLFEWYENHGLSGLLCPRPEMVIANITDKSKASNKYGYPGALIPEALKKLRDVLIDEVTIKSCGFPEMLAAWSKFKIDPHYNCDLTIATSLNVVSKEDILLKEEAGRAQDLVRKAKRLVYQQVGGKMISKMS